MKRNLTIQLDEDVVRDARVLAARRATSLSRLVADELERLVRDDRQRADARRRALELLEDGFDLGGPPYAARDELHDR